MKRLTKHSFSNMTETNDSFSNMTETNNSFRKYSETNDSFSNMTETNDSFRKFSETNDSFSTFLKQLFIRPILVMFRKWKWNSVSFPYSEKMQTATYTGAFHKWNWSLDDWLEWLETLPATRAWPPWQTCQMALKALVVANLWGHNASNYNRY